MHEWDVLEYPSPNAWLDDLRGQGWTRVPGVPGIPTERGTVIYDFRHQGPAGAVEPEARASSVRSLALLLAACALTVAVIVAADLIVMAIVQS